jgi:DNA-directed RNA polymerase specialized sigma subunit
MSEYRLPDCAKSCLATGESCASQECRMWINYTEDQNCSLVSIYQNGAMTLEEVAKRMHISFVRVSQIEKQALKKLSKRIKI